MGSLDVTSRVDRLVAGSERMDLSGFRTEFSRADIVRYVNDMVSKSFADLNGEEHLWVPFAFSTKDMAWDGWHMELARQLINHLGKHMPSELFSWTEDHLFVDAIGGLALPDLYDRRDCLMAPKNNSYYEFSGTPEFREVCIKRNLELVNAVVKIFEAVMRAHISREIDGRPVSVFDFSKDTYDYRKDSGHDWFQMFNRFTQCPDLQAERVFREVATAVAKTLIRDRCMLADPCLFKFFVGILGSEDFVLQLMTMMTKRDIVGIDTMFRIVSSGEAARMMEAAESGDGVDIMPNA